MTLIGNLGRAPEPRFRKPSNEGADRHEASPDVQQVPSQEDGDVSYWKLSVGTSRYKRNAAGERIPETLWHSVHTKQQVGHLVPGTQVYVEGELIYNLDPESKKKYWFVVSQQLKVLRKPSSFTPTSDVEK